MSAAPASVARPMGAVTAGNGHLAPYLLPQHVALLEASAISPDVASARGYYSALKPAELERLGFAPPQCRVPALVLPQHNVAGRKAGYQIRPDDPRLDAKGRPIKYESPQGGHPVLDVPPPARAALCDPSVPLLITEGSRKADAAVSAGLACVSVAGVYGFFSKTLGGGRLVLPDFDEIDLGGREVILAFDSDVMTKPQVADALARLAALLERRGAKVRAAYLPPGSDGAKVGLDDFLVDGHTKDDVLALAEPLRCASEPPPRFQFRSVAQLLDRKPPDYVVHKLVPAGASILMTGEPSDGKTTVALGMGGAIAAGIAWNGYATKPGVVAYVLGEGVGGVGRRLAAWKAHHGVDADNLFLLPEAANLLVPTDVDALVAAIGALPEPPVLIVLDTLARCMVGGDENSARDMGIVVAATDRLRRETGAAVMILHHPTKNGGAVRGSGALLGAADVHIKVERAGRQVTLSCEKMKDDEPFVPIALNLRAIDLGVGVGSVVLVRPDAPEAVSETARRVLAVLIALGPEGATAGQWEHACRKEGIAHSTHHDARKKLAAHHLVVEASGQKGGLLRPTAAALDLLKVQDPRWTMPLGEGDEAAEAVDGPTTVQRDAETENPTSPGKLALKSNGPTTVQTGT